MYVLKAVTLKYIRTYIYICLSIGHAYSMVIELRSLNTSVTDAMNATNNPYLLYRYIYIRMYSGNVQITVVIPNCNVYKQQIELSFLIGLWSLAIGWSGVISPSDQLFSIKYTYNEHVQCTQGIPYSRKILQGLMIAIFVI